MSITQEKPLERSTLMPHVTFPHIFKDHLNAEMAIEMLFL